jgi:hypothetical protein
MTRPETYRFGASGGFPNSRLPVLVCRNVEKADSPKECQELFAVNGWLGAWVNGIFPFHRLHSTAHDLPGPPSVFAALKLDHRVTMRLVPRFDALRRTDVVSSLNSTLTRTHRRRDGMLDAVIALPAEGARGDYDDGMSDTLGMYPAEAKRISSALQNDALIDSAHTGLTNALARVQATDAKVSVVWGGGE